MELDDTYMQPLGLYLYIILESSTLMVSLGILLYFLSSIFVFLYNSSTHFVSKY